MVVLSGKEFNKYANDRRLDLLVCIRDYLTLTDYYEHSYEFGLNTKPARHGFFNFTESRHVVVGGHAFTMCIPADAEVIVMEDIMYYSSKLFLFDEKPMDWYIRRAIDNQNIAHIPAPYLNEQVAIRMIQTNGAAINLIPRSMWTPSLCLFIVRLRPRFLRKMDDKMKTKKICRAAVAGSGRALQYVPVEMRTRKMERMAVRRDPAAFEFILNRHITRKSCLNALTQKGALLGNVPEHMLTAELCIAAVRSDGLALRYVPERFRTIDLYAAAVVNNAVAGFLVPTAIKKTLLWEAICAEERTRISNDKCISNDAAGRGRKRPRDQI